MSYPFTYGRSTYGGSDQLAAPVAPAPATFQTVVAFPAPTISTGQTVSPSTYNTSSAFPAPVISEAAEVDVGLTGVVFAWGEYGQGRFGPGGPRPMQYGRSVYGGTDALGSQGGYPSGVGTVVLFLRPTIGAAGVTVSPTTLHTVTAFPPLGPPTFKTTVAFPKVDINPGPPTLQTAVAFPAAQIVVPAATLATTTAFPRPNVNVCPPFIVVDGEIAWHVAGIWWSTSPLGSDLVTSLPFFLLVDGNAAYQLSGNYYTLM